MFEKEIKMNKKGFTLIELLVVVLIIGILAAVAMPQYQKAVEKARLTEGITTMSSLEKALNLYLLANGAPSSGQAFDYGTTLDSLDLDFPGRTKNSIYIGVGKSPNQYRIFAHLSPSFGGWWIHVDSDLYGGSIIRWEADGTRTCADGSSSKFKPFCESLKSQGLANAR